MIEVGSFRSGSCQGVSRRAFLKAGFSVPLALGLPGLSRAAAAGDSKAKSVLFVWLGGGPSHLDLCDPKPKAPSEFRGPFAAIETRTPGVRFTELLPRLARRSDRFSLVRTNINFNGGHRPAGSIGLCGAIANDGGEDANGRTTGYPPSFGAILADIAAHSLSPASSRWPAARWETESAPFSVTAAAPGARLTIPSW